MENEHIYLLLREKIPIKELIWKILDEKEKIERRESLGYHIERWGKISYKYFLGIQGRIPEIFTKKYNYYSYVLDGGKSYKYEKDRNSEFYEYTGISYQCRNLLLSVITDGELYMFDTILDKEKMYWTRYNDRIYYELSRKIMGLYK
jgi:hypothetical protein